MKRLSIVIPVFNEEETISVLADRLENALKKNFAQLEHEIIFIDDGSTDRTAQVVEKLFFKSSIYRLIQFSRNFGHHIAVSAGLEHSTGDYVVIMDGDLQDQPEEINKLYSKLQTGYDVVYGWRKEKKFRWTKKISSALFIKIMQFLLNENIEISSSIFRIMTRPVVDAVCALQEKQRYVLGLIGWVGFKHTFVEVKHGERRYGVTKYSFLKQLQLALNAIVSFSQFPLRFITLLGFLFTLFSFLLGCTVIIRYFTTGVAVMGWASTMVAILFVGGVQLCVVGIIGEYVGRIYVEVKNRPLYIVRKYSGYSEKAFKWSSKQ